MYNKNNFSKVNDKKVLHKVKKQWITISLSMLALLGASGIAAYNINNVEIHASSSEVMGSSAKNQNSSTDFNVASNHIGTPTDLNQQHANNDGDSQHQSSPNVASSNVDQNSNSNNDIHNQSSSSVTSSNTSQNTKNDKSNDDSTKSVSPKKQIGSNASQQTTSDANNNHPNTSKITDNVQSSSSSQQVNKSVPKEVVHHNTSDNNNVSLTHEQVERMALANLPNTMLIKNETNSGSQTDNNISDADQASIKSGSIAAWNSIHPNNQKTDDNQASSLDFNNIYYNDAYKGVIDAWNTYQQNNSSKGTQPVKNYSADNYKMNDSSKPNDPNSVDNKLNSGSYSVDSSNKAFIPVDPNHDSSDESKQVITSSGSDNTLVHNLTPSSIVNNHIDVINDDKQRKAYNDGITYFLTNQGIYDAETGRWNGQSQNDAYKPNKNSYNAYDQAYLGAQDAIKQQFNDNNEFSYDIQNGANFQPTQSFNGDENYTSGFNDVVNKVNNDKVAYVSNAIQLNNALDTTNQTSNAQSLNTGTINFYNQIKKINFLNDINFQNTNLASTGTTAGETDVYLNPLGNALNNGVNLTFDGQNHITDFGRTTYSLDSGDNNSNKWNLYVKNFNAMYGTNYYGPIKIQQNSGTLNYENVTYVGAQLSSAYNANVYVNGNLNVFSVGSYTSPFANHAATEGYNATDYLTGASGTGTYANSQENFEAQNMELLPGSTYYGSTTGGTALTLTGNMQMDTNSNMKLLPLLNGNSGHATGGNTATGLYLEGANAKVNINQGATLSVDPKSGADSSNEIAQGIYISDSQGSININGGNLNINMNGQPAVSNSNWDDGSITVKNNGHFNITGSNLASFSGYLLNVTGKLNVTNRGNFSIVTDGTGSSGLYLFNNGSQFNVDNPGSNITFQIKPLNNGQIGYGNLFSGNSINAYSSKYAINNNGIAPDYNSLSSLDSHYQINVPVGGIIQYDNGRNQLLTSSDSSNGAKYLSFIATPNVYMYKPIKVLKNEDGTYSVKGTIQLDNLPSNIGDGRDNDRVYIQVASDDKNIDESKLIQNSIITVNGNDTPIKFNQSDTDEYSHSGPITDKSSGIFYADSIKIPKSAKNGDTINFDYELPETPKKSVTIETKYFVMHHQQILTANSNGDNDNANFTDTLLNPMLSAPDKIDDLNGSVFVQNAPLNINDALKDGYNDGLKDITTRALTNNINSLVSDPTANTNYLKYKPNSSSGELLFNAYTNSYNSSFEGYLNGLQDIQNEQYNPLLPNNDNYNKSYQQAINDYQKGFNIEIGKNDFTTPSDSETLGYRFGFNNAKGVNDTINGQYDYSLNDINQANGYVNGHSAFNDGFNNNNQNVQQNNLAYRYGSEMNAGFIDAKNLSKNKEPKESNYPNNDFEYQDDINAYQNGQNYYSGMNAAIKNEPNANSNDVYKLAYISTMTGLNNSSIINPYNSAPQTMSYEIGNAVYNGVNDLINYKSKGNTRVNVAYQDYYNHAYDAGNDGFNSDINNSSSTSGNDNNQKFAYVAGQAAKAGVVDSEIGQNNTSHATNYPSNLPNQVYQQSRIDYQNGFNSNKLNISSNDSLAYNAGIAANIGAIDAQRQNSQTNKDTLNSDHNGIFIHSYDLANTDYVNGYNKNSMNFDASKSAAYNSGISAYRSIQDAIGNNQNNRPQNGTIYSNPLTYDNAQKAYQAGINNLNNADAQLDPIAYQIGKSAYQGIIDKQVGQTNVYKNYNDLDNQAYKQAQTDYQNARNAFTNQQEIAPDTNNSAAYNAGLAMQNGINDAKDGKYQLNLGNLTDPDKTSYQKAYQNAYDNYQIGIGNQQDNDTFTHDNDNLAYQAGKSVKNGIIDAQTQKSDHNDKTESPNQGAYNSAVNDYNAGVNSKDGHNTVTNPSSVDHNSAAYKAGQAAQQGLNDSDSGNEKHHYTTNTSLNAYNNALKAYQAGLINPSDSSSSDALKDPNAFNAGYSNSETIKPATDNGVKDGISAAQNNASSDPTQGYNWLNGNKYSNKNTKEDIQNAYKDAFSHAYKGYQQGQKDFNDVVYAYKNDSSSYNNGYNAYGKDANSGFNDQINVHSTDNQSVGYTNGQKMAQDVQNIINGNASLDSLTAAQKSYNDGFIANQNGKVSSDFNISNPAYHYGVEMSKGFRYNNQPQNSDSNYNVEINAYNNGKSAFNGMSTALNDQDKSDNGNTYYNNSYDAFKAGLTADGFAQYANAQQQIAYDYGHNTKIGINDALNNHKSTTGDNDAFDATKAGLTADLGTKFNGNQAAYNAGQAAHAGIIDDILNNNQHESDYQKDSQKAIYLNAKTAYNDALNSNVNYDVEQNVAVNARYATNAAIIDAKAANDKNENQYNNAPYKTIYDQAKKSYQDALNGDDSGNNYLAVRAGEKDQLVIKAALIGQTNFDDSVLYNAVKDGIFNKAPNDSDSENKLAYQIGQSAHQGIVEQQNGDTNTKDETNSLSNFAYNSAKNDYQNGRTSINKRPNANNSIAYNTGLAMQNGIIAAKDGTANKPDFGNLNNQEKNSYQNAYQNAYDNYQVGIGNQKDNANFTHDSNDLAYQAGQSAQNGIIDAQSQNNDHQDQSKDQAAYNNAQKDYQAGIKSNPSSALDSNSTAYKVGQAVYAGLDQAQNGNYKLADVNDKTFAYYQNQIATNAYNNAISSYRSGYGLTTNRSDKTNAMAYQAGQTDKDSAGVYIDAGYNQGLKDAQNIHNPNIADGASEINNTSYKNDDGNNKHTYINSYNHAYNEYRQGVIDLKADKYDSKNDDKFYQAVQTDYQQGFENKTQYTNASLNNSNIGYTYGFNNAKGINDTISGNYKPEQNDDNGYVNGHISFINGLNYLHTAHQDNLAYLYGKNMSQGFNDGKNIRNGDRHNSDLVAYDNGHSMYNGMIDSLINKQHVTDHSAAHDVAYQATNAGLINDSSKINSYNVIQQAAYDGGEAFHQAIVDESKGINNLHRYDKNSLQYFAYQIAQKDYQIGLSNNSSINDPNYNSQAYQAGLSTKDGIIAATNINKNLSDPKYQSDKLNPYYNGQWNAEQKANYVNAYAAYNVGSKGDTTSNVAKANYYANQAGYAHYLENHNKSNNKPSSNHGKSLTPKQSDDSSSTDYVTSIKPNINSDNNISGSNAFINGQRLNLNNESKNFVNSYNQAMAGFEASLNGKKYNNNNLSYQNGYKSALNYQSGIHDAFNGNKINAKGSFAYKLGYDAYNRGFAGKKDDKRLLGSLDKTYRKAYERAYHFGYIEYKKIESRAAKLGKANAIGNKHIPRSLKYKSLAYKDAYMKAFNEEIKQNIPKYVYNLKKIYIHNQAALTRHTRLKKYSKTPRYDRHVFKVSGYNVTHSGQVMYKVKGLGWINANDKLIDDVYYHGYDIKKPIQRIRVIKPAGTFVYNNKHFEAKHAIRKIEKGEVIKVQRIENLGGITRFYIGDGKYISSNKTIVEHVH